jgi:cyclic pyranopterin phosphate synthase
MGAKRTSELLPFCHPISLDDCQIDIHFDDVRRNEVVIDCVVRYGFLQWTSLNRAD